MLVQVIPGGFDSCSLRVLCGFIKVVWPEDRLSKLGFSVAALAWGRLWVGEAQEQHLNTCVFGGGGGLFHVLSYGLGERRLQFPQGLG